MKRFTSALAICALMGSSTAYAAQDMGLTLHNGPRAAAPRGGVGAQASVTIRLGERSVVRDAEKVALGFAAGPVLSVPVRGAIGSEKRAVAGLAAFTVKPGYSSTLSIAGQPIQQTFTRLGAAEADQQERKQSTGKKAAWVALVAGGVMVALIAAFVISCPTCGSD